MKIPNATLCPECNNRIFKTTKGELYVLALWDNNKWVPHASICDAKLELVVPKGGRKTKQNEKEIE